MKTAITTLILILGVASTGWATMYSGSLTSASGGGMVSYSDWDGETPPGPYPDATLSWVVDDTSHAGFWTYAYSFDVDRKGLSHIIIEVSKDIDGIAPDNSFTLANINTTYTTAGYALDTYSSVTQGNSNPNMPAPMYGLKWNAGGVLSFDFTIVTDRAPMWGDFYAVDGKNEPIPYAYNTGFGFDTAALIGNGNAFDATNGRAWLLVPDTEGGVPPSEVVPEPGTVLLFGSGLLGLLYVGRKRKK